MLQISWLRIMETMEVVMVWALLLLIRVVESHVYFLSSKPAPKIFAIGRYIYIYIYGYLMLVARDERTLVLEVFSHLQKQCQKMISSVITTSIEPLSCISRHGIFFFVLNDDYIIWKLSSWESETYNIIKQGFTCLKELLWYDICVFYWTF